MTKKKNKKSKNYFTEETERAVKLYNEATTKKEKELIYRKYLEYPLNKLVENVIHTYKLYKTGIKYENLFDYILEYLIEKMYKVDTDIGKAYSYLTVTARNFGFLLSQKNFDKNRNEYEASDCYELDYLSNINHNMTNKQEELSDFFDIFVSFMKKHLLEIFPNKEEYMIADAMLDFFKYRQDIEIFNKKALYILVKERIKCESRFLTNVVNILKENFYNLYELYKENGLKNIKYYNPVKRPYIKRRLKSNSISN